MCAVDKPTTRLQPVTQSVGDILPTRLHWVLFVSMDQFVPAFHSFGFLSKNKLCQFIRAFATCLDDFLVGSRVAFLACCITYLLSGLTQESPDFTVVKRVSYPWGFRLVQWNVVIGWYYWKEDHSRRRKRRISLERKCLQISKRIKNLESKIYVDLQRNLSYFSADSVHPYWSVKIKRKFNVRAT